MNLVSLRGMGSVVILALAALVLYDGVRIARALALSQQTTQGSAPYESSPANATARLLVIGDSTAVGTGAATSRDSVAGRIGENFPGTEVINRATVGARVEDLLAQLEGAATDSVYDVLLIQVGGNDILRFTALGAVEEQFDAALERAMEVARHVVVIAPGDVGTAPALPWPVSAIYSFRSSQLRRRLEIVAGLRDVSFVDLEAFAESDPFENDPGENYSRDGLHPSGNGYGHWYAALENEVPLALWLDRREPASEAGHHQ